MRTQQSWALDDSGFRTTDPALDRSWVNYVSNGQYGLRLNHLAAGFARTLGQSGIYVTHHGLGIEGKGRYLYCREGEGPPADIWNPSFMPSKARLDSFTAEHGTGWTRFTGVRDGLHAESLHFLPREGCFEIWKFRIENKSERRRSLHLYPQFEFLLSRQYEIDTVYYSWYTDSRLLPNGRTLVIFNRKPETTETFGFFHSIETPVSHESSTRVFWGKGDAQRPASLLKERLSNEPSGGDPYMGCFQFSVELEPGQSWENAVFIGEGREHLADVCDRFAHVTTVDMELEAVKALWRRKLSPLIAGDRVNGNGALAGTSGSGHSPAALSVTAVAPAANHDRQRVPGDPYATIRDPVLKTWLQGFFPYQIHQQSTGLVRGVMRGYRDVAQDAVGMSYFDMNTSRGLILDLLDKQHTDGRCLRQWNTAGPRHDERDFRDLPFWLVFAVDRYLKRGGDPSILVEQAPYLEGGRPDTLFGHMIRGLEYVLRFGRHGLLQIGVGDWNDALSNLGTEGESLWLNQMAYLTISLLEDMHRQWGGVFGLDLPFDVPGLKDRLYAGVIDGWTGDWFLRGYHWQGTAVGGSERTFLLPQAWFTISGMGDRDPAKAARALDSMVSMLDHQDGLLKCFPPFSDFDPEVGNLSALTPGMAENYAVYNHASTFGIYALLQAGRQEEALKYLDRLLPFRKDSERTLSEPYVLVNYYNGGYYPGRRGRGGLSWLTGTANWLAMIVFDHLLPKGLSW